MLSGKAFQSWVPINKKRFWKQDQKLESTDMKIERARSEELSKDPDI